MAGVNLNYEKKDRLTLDGSIRWNHSDVDAKQRQSTENFMSSSASTFGNSISQKYSRSNSWDGRLRVEWRPDSVWNILFRSGNIIATTTWQQAVALRLAPTPTASTAFPTPWMVLNCSSWWMPSW